MEMYKPRFTIDDSWDLNFLKCDNLTTSQQRVGKLPRVRCTDPVGLVKVRVSWLEHPRLSKKKKKTTSQQDVNMHHLDYLGQKCSRRFRFDIKC